MSSEYRLTMNPRTIEDAEARARVALEKAKKQMGFVPNMYATMANSPGLFETYLQGYAQFRQESGFTPAEQEVVFMTISRENGCRYCMAAHSFLAAGYSERHILEIILAIAVKTLSNYSNHLFDPSVDPVFASRAWND